MSIRIWEDIVSQKKQVEDQREKILNAFKQRKVADELGAVRAEKLFRPITKLLEEKPVPSGPPRPDYDIDDQTRNFKNELPFGEGDYEEVELREDPYESLKDQSVSEKVEDYAGFIKWLQKEGYKSDEVVPLPEKSSPGPKEITSLPDPDPDPEDLGEEVFPGEKSAPSYSEATRYDKPPKYKESRANDSSDLSTLTRFIRNNQNRPSATIETQKSKFLGYTVERAKERVYEIYTKRAKKVLEKGDRKSAIGQKELGPYEGKTNKQMHEMISEFEKSQPRTGSGLKAPRINQMMQRLSLGISSIIAGNTSIKLREEIRSIAKLLHQAGVISKDQKKKLLSIK